MATLTCSYCDRSCSSAEQAAGWCEYCKPRPMSPDQIAELAHSPEFRAMMAPHQKLLASLGKRPSPAIAVAMGQTVRLTDAEVDAIVHGGPAGTGEQPSITDRDPGDESRALVLPPPSKTLLELIHGLEAEVGELRADLVKLMVAFAALNVAGAATGATPLPHDPMANALAHSEPKPPWQR